MKDDKRETDDLKKEAEKLKLKNKELKIELFIRENSGLSDDELRQYYTRTPDAGNIFSSAEAFIAWVRHLPKATE